MNQLVDPSNMARKIAAESGHANRGMYLAETAYSTRPKAVVTADSTNINMEFRQRDLLKKNPWPARFYFFVVCMLLLCLAVVPALNAATRYSVASGNWSATSTWSATSGGAAGASVPVAGDDVFIVGGFSVTIISPAACGTLTFTNTTASTLTISLSNTLTVSGLVTIQRVATGNNRIAIGAGSMTAGSISFTSGSTTVSGHDITITSGSLTVSGNVTGTNTNKSGSITFLGAGTLKLGGTMFNASDGTLTAFAGSTVEYNAAGAQTIGNFAYRNLTLSGSGAKTVASGQTVTVNEILSLEGTATATVTGTLTYGSGATLQYNTSTSRTIGSEWKTPFTATGGVIIKNTGTITLAANKSFTASPLTINAGSTLNVSTFTVSGINALNLQCGGSTTGSSITGTGLLTLGGNVNVTNAASGTGGATIAPPVALGASRSFTVADDGTSATDLSVTGIVSGSTFLLTKAGAGTLTLSNVNTYTGGTTLSAGTLNINNARALGTTAGTFTINGGSINNTSGSAITTSAYPMSWGGSFTFVGTNNLTFAAAAVAMGANITVTTTANTLAVNGVISGTSRLLTKAGAGALTLSGTNTYTGGTTLSAGTLNINNAQALGTTAGTFTINGGSIDNTSGAAITTSAYPMSWGGNFIYVGSNDLNLSNGTVSMTSDVQLTTSAKTLTVGGAINAPTFNLTKAGAGSLYLGANAVTVNDLIILAGTFKTTSNTLTIKGAYSNAGTFQDNLGVIQFNGTAAQSILLNGFNTTINSLKINNAAGVSVGTALVVNTLDLTLGNIDIGANNITVNTTITGGSSTSYVKTSSSGRLTKNISNTVTQLFPVGNSAYNPVSVKNNSGSADVFAIRVLDEVYTDGLAAPVLAANRVQRTWDINKQTANGGSGIDFVFNWNSGEEAGVFVKQLWHHDGTRWNKQNGTTTVGATSLTYTGYTGTFSPFAIIDATYLVPVVLTDFRVQKAANATLIKWNTRQEQNSKDFIIQHSTNGTDWTNIGLVLAAGYSSSLRSYSYIHTNPVAGKNLYRLLQRDLDGRSTFTTILYISFDESGDRFAVLSNPVKNGQLKINMPGSGLVKLYNSHGQLLRSFNLTAGVQILDLWGYACGLYYLKASGETKTIMLQ